MGTSFTCAVEDGDDDARARACGVDARRRTATHRMAMRKARCPRGGELRQGKSAEEGQGAFVAGRIAPGFAFVLWRGDRLTCNR